MTHVHGSDLFEEPLDVVLKLVEAKRLDLSLVSLASITEAFLQEVQQQAKDEAFSLEELASFLVVASKLVAIKARLLVPTEDSPDEDETFLARLRAYQVFVTAGERLRERMGRGARFFSRGERVEEGGEMVLPYAPRVAHLTRLYIRLLARPMSMEASDTPFVFLESMSLEACMRDMNARLLEATQLFWSSLVPTSASREVRSVSFLAVLELLRTRVLTCEQTDLFGEMVLSRV